jgi:molybdopterin adenylyltransferase
MRIQAGIITISDRAQQGLLPDRSGLALKEFAEGYQWKVLAQTLVPNDKAAIQRTIREQIALGCQLILTSGGTGIAMRNVTPEAVRQIAVRELPGFGEAMRQQSRKLTEHGLLSRNLAVVVDRTLVVCLPGNASTATECLGIVASAIPHAFEALSEEEPKS